MQTNQSENRASQLFQESTTERPTQVSAADIKSGILGKRLDLIIIANLPVYLN